MKKLLFILLMLMGGFVNGQNCPENINNSPGDSGDSIVAYVYDNNGIRIDTFECKQTGNSNNIKYIRSRS